MRQPFSALVGVLAFFVFGCGGADFTGLDDPSFDSDSDGILNEVDQCPTDPETVNGLIDSDGCPDSALEFYQAIRVDLEAYWTTAFPVYGEIFRPIGIFASFSNATTTGCGVVYPLNITYCSRGEGIYYDVNMLQESLDLVGGTGPAFMLSHAMGGHVSWILEWTPWLTPNTLRLQADCWAGAWVADATSRGFLDLADPGAAVAQLVALRDEPNTWFDNSKYGSPEKRTESFGLGYMFGPPGCTSIEFFDL